MKYTLNINEDFACVMELSCPTIIHLFVVSVKLMGLHSCLEGKHSFRPAKFEAFITKALECRTPPNGKARQENLLPCRTFLPY